MEISVIFTIWYYVELGGLLWTSVLKLALPPQRYSPHGWLEHQEPFIHTALFQWPCLSSKLTKLMEKLQSREPPTEGRAGSLGEGAVGFSWSHEVTELSRSVIPMLVRSSESPWLWAVCGNQFLSCRCSLAGVSRGHGPYPPGPSTHGRAPAGEQLFPADFGGKGRGPSVLPDRLLEGGAHPSLRQDATQTGGTRLGLRASDQPGTAVRPTWPHLPLPGNPDAAPPSPHARSPGPGPHAAMAQPETGLNRSSLKINPTNKIFRNAI